MSIWRAPACWIPAPFARAQHQSPTAPATATALTPADYARWETLGTSALSPDGKWIAYDFRRGNGSSEVVYRALDTRLGRIVAVGAGQPVACQRGVDAEAGDLDAA